MDAVSILVLAAYATLVLELLFLALPSEASTWQLLFEGAGDRDDDALGRARRRATPVKLLLYLVPTAVGVVLFVIPLVAAVFPAVIADLWPVAALGRDEVRWGGVGLMGAGRAITVVSVLQLRRSGYGHQPRGLFAWSRNPGLVGMYCFYVGACLVFPCVVLLAGFFLYAANMHGRVLLEECYLTRRHGGEYREYLRRVPRYVGIRT